MKNRVLKYTGLSLVASFLLFSSCKKDNNSYNNPGTPTLTITDNAIDGIVPFYSVMDFSLQYQLNKYVGFYGSVNNIANARYFTRRADNYPGPGIVPSDARSYYLTIQVNL